MENGAANVENGLVVPQKIRHRITIRPRNSILGIYPSELKTGLKKISVRQCS